MSRDIRITEKLKEIFIDLGATKISAKMAKWPNGISATVYRSQWKDRIGFSKGDKYVGWVAADDLDQIDVNEIKDLYKKASMVKENTELNQVNSFLKKMLNESEEDGFGKMEDGWDKDDLLSLINWLEKVQEVTYEIKNARRGAYCSECGDNVTSLVDHLSNLKSELEEVIEELEESSESEEE